MTRLRNRSPSFWNARTSASNSIFESWKEAFPAQKKRTDYSDGDPDKEVNYKVLREANCPAVLIELGFITNPQEERFLVDKKNQEIMGLAIATGIYNFLEGR